MSVNSKGSAESIRKKDFSSRMEAEMADLIAGVQLIEQAVRNMGDVAGGLFDLRLNFTRKASWETVLKSFVLHARKAHEGCTDCNCTVPT